MDIIPIYNFKIDRESFATEILWWKFKAPVRVKYDGEIINEIYLHLWQAIGSQLKGFGINSTTSVPYIFVHEETNSVFT